MVSDAIEAWEFSRHARGEFGTSDISSALSPLVLAFTGPTGVGKSETAYRLARALLPKVQGATNNKKWPNGLLILRGEVRSLRVCQEFLFHAHLLHILHNSLPSLSPLSSSPLQSLLFFDLSLHEGLFFE